MFLIIFFLFLLKKKKKTTVYGSGEEYSRKSFRFGNHKEIFKRFNCWGGGVACVYLSEGESRLPINHLGSSALLMSSSRVRGDRTQNATMQFFFFFVRSDICINKLVKDALDLLGCLHCWNCLEEFCHANGGFLKGEVIVT